MSCGVLMALGANGVAAGAHFRGSAPQLGGATPDDSAVGVATLLASPVPFLHWTLGQRVSVNKASLADPALVRGFPSAEGGRPSKMPALGCGVCVRPVQLSVPDAGATANSGFACASLHDHRRSGLCCRGFFCFLSSFLVSVARRLLQLRAMPLWGVELCGGLVLPGMTNCRGAHGGEGSARGMGAV